MYTKVYRLTTIKDEDTVDRLPPQRREVDGVTEKEYQDNVLSREYRYRNYEGRRDFGVYFVMIVDFFVHYKIEELIDERNIKSMICAEFISRK